MRILITNDDGIESNGIRILAHELSKIASVVVVSPKSEKSAVGHSITLHKPIRLERVDIGENIEAYSVTGSPADCVKIGLDVITKYDVDFIISGINNRLNLGIDILYSGTVSGALEGAIHGFKSIAVSVDAYKDEDFESAAKMTLDLVLKMEDIDIDEFTALNFNLPTLPYEKIKGVKLTKQSKRKFKDFYIKRSDPKGKPYYWVDGTPIEDDEDQDVDYKPLKEGYASLTPISTFLTNNSYLEKLRNYYGE
jgi:5'-nucleotidase